MDSLRLPLIALVAAMLVSCAGAGSPEPPTATPLPPTATPDPCSAQDMVEMTDSLQYVVDRFDDAVTLGDSTPRNALPPVISEMQAARRDVKQIDVPQCALEVQTRLVAYMDAIIEGFTMFLANEPGAGENDVFWKAETLLEGYTQAVTNAVEQSSSGYSPPPVPPSAEKMGALEAELREYPLVRDFYSWFRTRYSFARNQIEIDVAIDPAGYLVGTRSEVVRAYCAAVKDAVSSVGLEEFLLHVEVGHYIYSEDIVTCD